MKRRAMLGALLWVAGCGGLHEDVETTIATLTPVRGATTLDGESSAPVQRAIAGDRVETAERSLARLSLDDGPQLVVDGSSALTLVDGGTVELANGRLFAELQPGERLEVRTAHGSMRASDAALSVRTANDGTHAYVVRGEVAWTRGEQRGIASAGQELTLDAARAATAASTLWTDWTGGLARPGPVDASGPEGVGLLEARVPDEIGQARWPLVIRRLDVRVKIEGDLAITEVDQLFFNPASETVEGLYRIRVPEGAVLQRFAVDRDAHLVDGYVREKAQARQAYEQQVYRGSTDDPALLEWDAPGNYRARIYPIQPGETRRIVIRYAEWLRASSPGAPRLYRYPMGGGARAPHVQEMSIRAEVDDAVDRVRAGMGATVEEGAVNIRRSDFRPRADFWMELVGGAGDTQRAWTASYEPPAREPGAMVGNEADERDFFYLPLVLPLDWAEQTSQSLDLVIVADVSAGTDRSQLELGRSVIESLTTQLGPEDRIAIVSGDLRVRSVIAGQEPALAAATPQNVEAALDGLARVSAGGATDLGETLAQAAALLDPARPSAVVYVGDGAPTVGELRARGLIARLARLPHPIRLYAVAVGADANLELLETLARGGGLAMRVEERAQAADAALTVLAHAARPVAHGVVVELGTGIANAFPRRAMDAVLGDVFAVVGRVGDGVPTEVTVKGTIAGEAFERTIAIEVAETEETTDLRLRWASERLRQLLLEGSGREEIAELGTRYGLITPFTSYYVPSRRELGQSGAYGLIDQPLLEIGNGRDDDEIARGILAVALGPLSIAGCTDREKAGSSDSVVGALEPSEPPPPPPPASAPQQTPEGTVALAEEANEGDVETAQMAEPSRDEAPSVDRSRRSAEAAPVEQAAMGGMNVDVPADPFGEALELRGTGEGGGGTGAGYGMRAAGFGDAGHERADSTTVTQTITTRTTTTVTLADHQARRCSDAASLSLGDRRALWTERLAQAGASPSEWLSIYRTALHSCEAESWRDRRAFWSLMLGRAGGVPVMIQVYQLSHDPSARVYLRSEILRRVRTPDDLRAVRAAFGLGDGVDWMLVSQILSRAPTEELQIRALRRLSAQYPDSFELKLRLLSALERGRREDEAKRLADAMRADPLADPGVRTAIGEMFIRQRREDDARRVFSEIVEFAPLDELARRRLGDLYRAHGWYEDAYRQYQTLAEIRPDDTSVQLLLAQAAAGAGRVDEALRLERGLMQTAQPGESQGIARTALLWSSVRYARLREAARRTNDEDRLRTLTRRMRASGILREAKALRVTLVWSHPDAQLALLAGHPGLTPTRPTDITPEFGLEAFDLEEQEPGMYRFEVTRTIADANDVLTTMRAQLVVVWNEGGEDEQVRIVDLTFDPLHRTYAWTLTGRTLTEAMPGQR